jgi:cytochrome oxidase Cu insertion factor (SCO1/SenC/PrrC family)
VDDLLRRICPVIDALLVWEAQGIPFVPPEEKEPMPKVELNVPAPDFQLADFTGKPVHLSDFRGQTVLLVFNRGFV